MLRTRKQYLFQCCPDQASPIAIIEGSSVMLVSRAQLVRSCLLQILCSRLDCLDARARELKWWLCTVAVALFFGCAPACYAVPSPPTFSPLSEVSTGATITVTISAGTGTTIYYTLSGTVPTTSSPAYSSPLTINNTTQVNAIAVDGTGSSPVASAFYVFDFNAGAILQPFPNQWYRGDYGLVNSGGSISVWTDFSGYGRDATQSTPANQPTVGTNAVNGLIAVNFNGTSQFLNMPSVFFSPNTSQFYMFVVVRPTSTSAQTFLDYGYGASGVQDAYGMDVQAPKGTYHSYYRGTGSTVSASNALAQNTFQLFESAQPYNPNTTATIFTNGIQLAQNTSMQPMDYGTFTYNYIGQSESGGAYFQGQIAEVICYIADISTAQRQAIENYLMQKYQLLTTAPAAPKISIPTSTLTAPAQVALSARPTDVIYFTVDGSQPNPATSPVYLQPINIAWSQQLQAIAVGNGAQSPVSSATYTLDSTQYPAPNASDTTPLNVNLQLPTNAVPQ